MIVPVVLALSHLIRRDEVKVRGAIFRFQGVQCLRVLHELDRELRRAQRDKTIAKSQRRCLAEYRDTV